MPRVTRERRRGALAHLLPVLLIAPLLAAGCGGDADADGAPLFPWMAETVRAMPGYEIEPETFDRYALEAHHAACITALSGGKDPEDPKVRAGYVAEMHRYMLDRAFSEGRTDLADVLTRAYLAAEAAR